MQLPFTTVHSVLKRFAKAGHRNDRRAEHHNCGLKRALIGSAAIEAQLLSNKVLQDMAPLCLQRRVDYIVQKYNVPCNYQRLLRFYRQNNLSYRVSSQTWRVDAAELAGLNEQRHQFAVKLKEIKESGDPVVSIEEVTPSHLNVFVSQVYFDESTFNTWQTNKRTWQKKTRAIIMDRPAVRWGRCTIFGAVGNCLTKPTFMMANRTGGDETLDFLRMVKTNLHEGCRPWLLFDQHRSHRARPVQDFMAQHFRPLMVPKQSCQFNPVEHCWR